MVKVNKRIMCVVFEKEKINGVFILAEECIEIPNEILNLISFCPAKEKSKVLMLAYHADPNKIVKCPFGRKNCLFNVYGYCLLAMHHDWWKILAEENHKARSLLKKCHQAYTMRKKLDIMLRH